MRAVRDATQIKDGGMVLWSDATISHQHHTTKDIYILNINKIIGQMLNYRELSREEKARLYYEAIKLRKETNWGYIRIGNYLELPRSLIVHWLHDGSKPYRAEYFRREENCNCYNCDINNLNEITHYFQVRKLKSLKEASTREFELIYALRFYHKLPNKKINEITGVSFNRSTRREEGDKILAKYSWHYPNQKDLLAVLKNHWLLFNHFIGFYLCDGRSSPLLNKSQFSLHLKKGSDEFALLMIYKNFFDILPKTYYPGTHAEIIPDESSYSYCPTNTLLAKYLTKSGFKRTGKELKLPNWSYENSKSFGALLAGVIDGDGYITCDDIGRCNIGICNSNTDFLNELDILISRYFGVTGYYSSGKLRIHPSKKKDRMKVFRESVFPQLRLERKMRKAEELNKRYPHAPKMKIGDTKRG